MGLTHFFPAAHFHLGEGLIGAGRESEAIAAYETALGMGFDPQMSHARLAELYRLRNPAKAKQHHARSLSASSCGKPRDFIASRRLNTIIISCDLPPISYG